MQEFSVKLYTRGLVLKAAYYGGWLATVLSYELMYRIALVIPLIYVSGVLLAPWGSLVI